MDGNDAAGLSSAGAGAGAGAGSGSGSGIRPDHRSPPHPPPPVVAVTAAAAASQSKRDRKRQALNEKLQTMSNRLQRDRDLVYRDQLQKIQYEVGLVQRFDPYDVNALEKAAELASEYRRAHASSPRVETSRSLLDMAGPKFPDFIDEIEDLIEKRDAALAAAKAEYEQKLAQYKNTHAFHVETAKREHFSLTDTLRDRLINSLAQKRNRLTREKEAFEINDSSAVLLNPSQFSLTNPSSPGGLHGKRATRMRKDVEDMNVFPDGKKRKRNPGEDEGSPAPNRRPAHDPNSYTPLWQSDKARLMVKQAGSILSIDKLFTDKELSMHYNMAAQGAHMHIVRNSRPGGNGSPPVDSDPGANGADNDADGIDKDDAEADTHLSAAAPAMERQVSHATRSTRGAGGQNQNSSHNLVDDKFTGVEGIANLELPSNLDLVSSIKPPNMPPPVPQQYLKPVPRSADHNSPASLSLEDINSDLAVMGMFKQHGQTNKPGAHLDSTTGMRRILEAVAVPCAKSSYVAWTRRTREDPSKLRESLGLSLSNLREQPSPGPSNGAQPMSRQSSQGAVAMSRQGTNGSTRGKSRRG